MTEGNKGSDVIFAPLGSEEISDNVTCVESLCMSCFKQGHTKLLLTKIPFYKDIVVSSFHCDHCSNHNTQVQLCEDIQNRGVTYEIQVKGQIDMNRQVVKGQYANISIPQLELEIPRESQSASINTIEGVLQRVVEGLEQDQIARQSADPESYEKVKQFIEKVNDLKSAATGFDFILDDPSGNSFVENPFAPKKDENGKITHYIRTVDQDSELGLNEGPVQHDAVTTADDEEDPELDFKNEVMVFSTNCPSCGHACNTNMKSVKIPFFKEVIIMATVCDNCGHKSDEVKSGVGVEAKGVKFTCKVTSERDLSRDVLKSETSSLCIPELDVELEHGSLGGRFTTMEGLLNSFMEGVDHLNPFAIGDSSDNSKLQKLNEFREKAARLLELKEPFTVVLDDPAGSSFVSRLDEVDENLTEERYERNYDQNEFLGLNDIKTENYETEVANADT